MEYSKVKGSYILCDVSRDAPWTLEILRFCLTEHPQTYCCGPNKLDVKGIIIVHGNYRILTNFHIQFVAELKEIGKA